MAGCAAKYVPRQVLVKIVCCLSSRTGEPFFRFHESLPGKLLTCQFLARYAEFSQAVVEKTLERGCNLMYYGLFREDAQHKKVLADLEFKVFRHWDSLDTSPPKTRPRPQSTLMVDNLHLLSCTAAGPIWPDALLTKFKAETTEHKELLALKDSFEREFPPPRDTSTTTSASALPPRVSGLPDFTIEHGAKPIDVSRVVGASMSAPPGASDRWGLTSARNVLNCGSRILEVGAIIINIHSTCLA